MMIRTIVCFACLFCTEIVSQEPAVDQPPVFRALTYNIHHGEGTDGKLDLVRISKVIRQTDADIVALQEVDQRVKRSGDVDQASELSKLTGLHQVFGSNIPLQGGRYGNAILSRWPIERTKNHALPCLNEGEQRGVLEAYIRSPRGLVRVLATHFDHRRDPAERKLSTKFVNELLLQDPQTPALLMGDLNAQWQSEELVSLADHWRRNQAEPLPTIPVTHPERQIDFVLVSPEKRWTSTRTSVIEESVASDHRPLLMELQLNPMPWPATDAQWHGYPQHQIEVSGRKVTVVAPKQEAAGRPWVWHGEFFGHKPAPDIALLEKGFHLVYMQVPDMLGSPPAVAYWNQCYNTLTSQYGLAPKVALVGLSRGGLYCYNWAIANPDKIACIYGDAPVCDFKSWPGGKGTGPGHAPNWQRVLELWGFADESSAIAYEGNPVDQLTPLARAGVPLLHVFGDADEVVPWEENTGLVAERYPKLGGQIELIRKPGVKHHPHGLEDSTPIVNFIMRHAMPPLATIKQRSHPVDDQGIWHIDVESIFQRAPTEIQVLLPDDYYNQPHCSIAWILPVEAGLQSRYGNGLHEVQRANLHNQHHLICIAPTFSDLPWYADHPSDAHIQQEAYLIQSVLPQLRWQLPLARHDRDGRLLIGFSKSGHGAWTLLLRHLDLFRCAVAWDAPLMLDAPGKYGSGLIFGTTENFKRYQLTGLIQSQATSLKVSSPKLIHIGYGNFREEHQQMEAFLNEQKIPHRYIDGPQRTHHWNSGWLEQAFKALE